VKWTFWLAAGLIAYTYFGYPAWLWLRCRWRPKPVHKGPYAPMVSIVMVVHNEASSLDAKVRNLLALSYPPGLCEIVVVSDGSTDSTSEILTAYRQNPHVRALLHAEQAGKASGLNSGVAAARGEIVFFVDARQTVEPDALRLLMENFADPTVGCASGELVLGDCNAGESAMGMGLYWQIEKCIRQMESSSGSVVGATGALYAVRRNLLSPLPPETVLDDVYIPMQVAQQGFRIVFDERARAWDLPDQGRELEFSRKVRTLSGNYQLLQLAPWLLSRQNPLRFEFVSHKLLRLLVPLALAVTVVTSALLRAPIYRVALALQLAFYGLSLIALLQWKRGPIARVADASLTFVVLNTAALVALANFVTGRKTAWSR
jgi:biofilm PGA synthesis N-glycosyltransferase PgaC